MARAPGVPPAKAWSTAINVATDSATAAPGVEYIRPLTLESPLLTPTAVTSATASVLGLALDLRQPPPPILPAYLAAPEPVTLFVHQGGLTMRVATTRSTVAGALVASHFRIGLHDYIRPAPTSPVAEGMHVYIRPAKYVSIVDGDNTISTYTAAETVGGALEGAGVLLDERDRAEPGLGAAVRDEMSIKLTRVQEAVKTLKEVVPRSTVYRDDPNLEAGQTVVVEPGRDGVRHQRVRVIYEEGSEVSREVVDSWLEPAPLATVIARGTKAEAKTLETPEGPRQYLYTLQVYATWYNASHGGKSRDNPWYGITATGVPVGKGIVAVDPAVIPFGTRMYIPGYGSGVAADTGGGIKGNRIDLAYPEGIIPDWRTGWVTIYILAP